MTRIKECPFCGSEAHIETVVSPHKHSISFMPDVEDYTVFISCTKCTASIAGDDKRTYDAAELSAIEQWNVRTVEHSYNEKIATFDPPFKYDEYCQSILNKDNLKVLDIRGWGFIQYEEDAEKKQDDFGREVTRLMNAECSNLDVKLDNKG